MKKAHLPALSPSLHGDLLEKMISASDLSEKWRRVARKDILLVDAALQFDKIIVSLDDEARAAFAEIAREQPLLRDVIWVNPAHPEEDVIAWLEKGAPHDKTRTLGAYTAASHTTSKTPTRKK